MNQALKETEYVFTITIIDNPDWISPEELAELEDIDNELSDFEQFEYEWDQYSFTDLRDEALKEPLPEQPIPRIVSLNYAGLLTIAFDK
eukprot:CAMPEP_0176358392 /NCGR_PEP_ID=MMETSP0126-20121128/15522_1 /TAXON_ID=141414 ORGANISM="Strombidinopsis acuminatum, Strain SPMC142" /NCGR_SAMPLE_ID=MMETSP0126 /ASSEMBLY_ACC=CAM_ASM_000229 /LENGTH=88 /DNA_ID=CAMNT_0017712543 /DNA_START=697 /DNA_END=962 /DNA_ORIENTATION=+